jgi:hypothetical protein
MHFVSPFPGFIFVFNPEIRFCRESVMPFWYSCILHINDMVVTVNCLRAHWWKVTAINFAQVSSSCSVRDRLFVIIVRKHTPRRWKTLSHVKDSVGCGVGVGVVGLKTCINSCVSSAVVEICATLRGCIEFGIAWHWNVLPCSRPMIFCNMCVCVNVYMYGPTFVCERLCLHMYMVAYINILWRIWPLLGNDLVNPFPLKRVTTIGCPLLGKISVVTSSNNRWYPLQVNLCVFCVVSTASL